jgi:hypothetical protein
VFDKVGGPHFNGYMAVNYYICLGFFVVVCLCDCDEGNGMGFRTETTTGSGFEDLKFFIKN